MRRIEECAIFQKIDCVAYRIPDINNDLIDVDKEDLIQLKKLIARKTLTQKGL